MDSRCFLLRASLARRVIYVLAFLLNVALDSQTLQSEPPVDREGRSYWITLAAYHQGQYGLVSTTLDGMEGQLISRANAPVVEPSWSPDGNKLAYVSFEDGPGQICVIDVKNQKVSKLTNGKDWERNPMWSPDGRRIAFTSRRDGHEQIYVMNADGTEQTNLSKNSGFDADPTWSPDGKKIAFASNRGAEGFQLYVMKSDGSEQQEFSNRKWLGWVFPDWSPDGKSIVLGEFGPRGGVALVLFDIETKTFTDIVREGRCHTFARWSPDGRYIAFARFDSPPPSYRPGTQIDQLTFGDLMLFEVETKKTTVLTEKAVPGWGPRPTWKPLTRSE
jgi:tol-pal system beta propeller repeat protein TolB